MKSCVLRFSLLALIMYFCIFSVAAVDAIPSDNTAICSFSDVILILDMTNVDDFGQLYNSVGELFTDLLPTENLRIGIIGYGYTDPRDNVYSFKSTDVNIPENGYIHQLVQLGAYSVEAEQISRDSILQAIIDAPKAKSHHSPHGHAVLAAVDMLLTGHASPGDACVILISDGVRASTDHAADNLCKEEAIALAKVNEWPIYTIELDLLAEHSDLQNNDYDSLDSYRTDKKSYPRILMTEIAWKTGARKQESDGSIQPDTWVIEPPKSSMEPVGDNYFINKIQEAILDIFGGPSEEQTVDEHGMLTIRCPVGNLTCEYLVYINSADLENVQVFYEKNGEKILQENHSVTVERGTYHTAVRLRCPFPGQWYIEANGTAGQKIILRHSKLVAPRIELIPIIETCSPELQNGVYVLDEKESLTFHVRFLYGENRLKLDPTDHSLHAKLELKIDTQNQTIAPLETVDIFDLIADGDDLVTKMYTDYIDPTSLHFPADEDTGIYQAKVLIYPEQGVDAMLESDPIVFHIPIPPISLNSNEPINLEDVPVFSVRNFSLSQLLSSQSLANLEYMIGSRDPGGDPYYLLSSDGELTQSLSGSLNNLDLVVNGCIGEQRATLQLVHLDNRERVTLLMNVINLPIQLQKDEHTVELQEGTYAVELYDRLPSKVYANMIPVYSTEHLLTWTDPNSERSKLELTWEDDYDHSVVQLAPGAAPGQLRVCAVGPGETTLHVTLSNGAYHLGENNNRVYESTTHTIHIRVRSTNELEKHKTLLVIVCFLLIAALVSFLIWIKQKIQRKKNANIKWWLTIEDSLMKTRVICKEITVPAKGKWLYDVIDENIIPENYAETISETSEGPTEPVHGDSDRLKKVVSFLKCEAAMKQIQITPSRHRNYFITLSGLPKGTSPWTKLGSDNISCIEFNVDGKAAQGPSSNVRENIEAIIVLPCNDSTIQFLSSKPNKNYSLNLKFECKSNDSLSADQQF